MPKPVQNSPEKTQSAKKKRRADTENRITKSTTADKWLDENELKLWEIKNYWQSVEQKKLLVETTTDNKVRTGCFVALFSYFVL